MSHTSFRLRRRGLLGAGLALAAPGVLRAQSGRFPSQPIEIINMSSPGGGTDIFLRVLAIGAREELGTEIVVMSRTGGTGAAMVNYVNNRPRDGHTLMVMNPGMYQTVSKGRTPVKLEELVPIVRGTEDPQFLIAKKGAPVADARRLLEQGRSRPVKIGGTHVGGTDWVAAMAFTRRANFAPPLYVPFGGGADILTNVIGGNLEVGVLNFSEAEAQIEAGEVVPVMVMSSRRSGKAPDTPTTVEMGVPVQMATLRGVGALRGVPEERLALLERAFLKAMDHPQYQTYLQRNGLDRSSIAGAKEFEEQLIEAYQAFNEVEAEARRRG